jgi:hypothetical protein
MSFDVAAMHQRPPKEMSMGYLSPSTSHGTERQSPCASAVGVTEKRPRQDGRTYARTYHVHTCIQTDIHVRRPSRTVASMVVGD